MMEQNELVFKPTKLPPKNVGISFPMDNNCVQFGRKTLMLSFIMNQQKSS